jgi:hypothetical protein
MLAAFAALLLFSLLAGCSSNPGPPAAVTKGKSFDSVALEFVSSALRGNARASYALTSENFRSGDSGDSYGQWQSSLGPGHFGCDDLRPYVKESSTGTVTVVAGTSGNYCVLSIELGQYKEGWLVDFFTEWDQSSLAPGTTTTTLGGTVALGDNTPFQWSSSQSIDPAAFQTTQGINGISCPSNGLCVAVDGQSHVISTTNPGAGASAWHVTTVEQGDGILFGVSCPSTDFCVAVDSGGNSLTSTDPTGGSSAWTVSDIDGSNEINAVSCPSVDFCAAVDRSGDALTSADPAGGASAWTVTNIDGANELEDVSCLSASFCIAVDGSNLNAFIYNGNSWSAMRNVEPPDTGGLQLVACVTESFCVAADQVGDVETYNGHSWSSPNPMNSGPGTAVESISCSSVYFCLAVDGSNAFLYDGSGWQIPSSATSDTLVNPTFPGDLNLVSCADPLFCVAAGYDGNMSVGTRSG